MRMTLGRKLATVIGVLAIVAIGISAFAIEQGREA